MAFEHIAQPEREPKAEFRHGDIVYERSTGHSYEVQGYTPEGKVAAVRIKTEGEGKETSRNIREGETMDAGAREFDEDELVAAPHLDLLSDAELTPEHARDLEEIRKAREEREGKVQ